MTTQNKASEKSKSQNDGLLDKVCAILEKHDIKETPKAKRDDKTGKKKGELTLLVRADAAIEEIAKLKMPVMRIGILEFVLAKTGYSVLRFCSKVGHLATDEKPEEETETSEAESDASRAAEGATSTAGGPQPTGAAATAAA